VKPIIFILTLLLAGLYTCSLGEKDSADADYCIYFIGEDSLSDKHKFGNINFLLLKNNNILEPIVLNLDTVLQERSYPDAFSCWSMNTGIDFVDESDIALFSHTGWGIGGYCGNLCSFQRRRQAKFPTVIKENIKKGLKAEDLLSLQNRIFDAHMRESIRCELGDGSLLIDTSYRIDFRVRITGKCSYLATKILLQAE
jgi:hypothetical protein